MKCFEKERDTAIEQRDFLVNLAHEMSTVQLKVFGTLKPLIQKLPASLAKENLKKTFKEGVAQLDSPQISIGHLPVLQTAIFGEAGPKTSGYFDVDLSKDYLIKGEDVDEIDDMSTTTRQNVPAKATDSSSVAKMDREIKKKARKPVVKVEEHDDETPSIEDEKAAGVNKHRKGTSAKNSLDDKERAETRKKSASTRKATKKATEDAAMRKREEEDAKKLVDARKVKEAARKLKHKKAKEAEEARNAKLKSKEERARKLQNQEKEMENNDKKGGISKTDSIKRKAAVSIDLRPQKKTTFTISDLQQKLDEANNASESTSSSDNTSDEEGAAAHPPPLSTTESSSEPAGAESSRTT